MNEPLFVEPRSLGEFLAQTLESPPHLPVADPVARLLNRGGLVPHDAELARYLRIEERELEADGRN